jgi:type III pantothenate kinase
MTVEQTFLLLDIGNTRVKWALVQPSLAQGIAPVWLAEGACLHDRAGALAGEWAGLPLPARVFGANVAGEQAVVPISDYWQQRGVAITWLRPQDGCCGVKNTYDQPGQLGADRWVALVGAWRRQREACLVISAGTAMTIDILDAQGTFQGGMILPGRRLMLDSLMAGTHALTAQSGHVVQAPKNTADAMASGIAAALTAPIHETFARQAATCPTLPACLVTGGDAEWLVGQLAIRCTIAPRLILEGLLEIALEETRT